MKSSTVGYRSRGPKLLFPLNIVLVVVFLTLGIPHKALGWGPADLLQISMAFVTNLAIHESGHFFLAESVGAQGNRLNFFSNRDGSLFLGLSTVKTIDERSKLPYILAGEIATGFTYEIARSQYRSNPTTYNRSLLFFSGTEFLWYCIYAFYLTPTWDTRNDPVGISQETGLDPEIILGIAATQTVLNAYRVFSGQDHIFPYFIFDRESVAFLVGIRF